MIHNKIIVIHLRVLISDARTKRIEHLYIMYIKRVICTQWRQSNYFVVLQKIIYTNTIGAPFP